MFKIAVCDETLPQTEQMAKILRSCVSGDLAIDCFAASAELKKAVADDVGKYRLLVLGTELADEDGIRVAKELRKLGFTADIVFCTEQTERALEAFGAYPTAYIRKPCTRIELCDVIAFVAERHGKKPSIILSGTDGRKHGFRVDDIIYIEVFRTELDVHCVNGTATCTGSLREVCEKLPADRFYRSHRSFIVNLGRIGKIEKYQFTMDNGDVVTVAKNRYAEAKKAWHDFFGRA